MQITDKIDRLSRACSLYGKPFFSTDINPQELERVVRSFTHKLFGTRRINDLLEINLEVITSPDPTGSKVKLYNGINVTISVPRFGFIFDFRLIADNPMAILYESEPIAGKDLMIN